MRLQGAIARTLARSFDTGLKAAAQKSKIKDEDVDDDLAAANWIANAAGADAKALFAAAAREAKIGGFVKGDGLIVDAAPEKVEKWARKSWKTVGMTAFSSADVGKTVKIINGKVKVTGVERAVHCLSAAASV